MTIDTKTAQKPPKVKRLRAVLPLVWELTRPRVGLLSLGFLLMVVNRVASLVLPYSTKFLFDSVIPKRSLHLLDRLVLGVLGATVIQGITSFLLTQLLSKEAQRLITELRQRVQAHISRLPVAFYDTNKTGMLVSRIMSDVEGVRNLLGTGLVDFAGGLLTSGIALVLLVRISPTMTFIALGFLLCFALALTKAFGTIRPIFRERGKINAEVTGRLTESLGGVRVIKGYHAEEREEAVFAHGVKRLLANVMRTLTATSVMSLSASVLLGVVGAVVTFVGARQIMAGTMTVGGLVSFTAMLAFLIAPMAQAVGIGTQLTEAVAGLERTQEVLHERPEDQDPRRTVSPRDINGTIEFHDVSFSYDGVRNVLRDISFRAEPGTVTALVGSSGSGKSTTIGLISAFYIPTKGKILVDGTDLSTVRLDSYRTRLGVVLQESFLFDGTIRENVAFSRPDASTEEILSACRIARVDEFAESFADKYETVVGERGVKLSGGQRQRISIARAILAEPRILILDEATSSLDSESEQMIQQGLSYLMKGRTTFVIAHRLSTIRRADQILVMEQGQIVERGTHEELYAQQGRYHDLYTRQHGVEHNLFLAPGEGDIDDAGTNGNQSAKSNLKNATHWACSGERSVSSMESRERPTQSAPSAIQSPPNHNNNNDKPVIRVEQLRRHYPMGDTVIRAVDGVTLSVKAGEFVGLLGTSGSGKSSVLNLIAGLDRPTSGSVIVQQRNLSELSRQDLAHYRLHTVGMVFQSFNLIASMTLAENVELPMRFAEIDRGKRDDLVRTALTRVGLQARINHRPSQLSGGEQQRAALARALINRPQLLLADEPTGNLDSRTGTEIMNMIGEFNRQLGMTVVMVTHERALAERYAQRLIFLADGKLVRDESLSAAITGNAVDHVRAEQERP